MIDDIIQGFYNEWKGNEELLSKLSGLIPLIKEHGSRSEKVRQYILTNNKNKYGQRFENCALTLILCFEAFKKKKKNKNIYHQKLKN